MLARREQDDRWAAVCTRDRAASFVYAVRTTGVYCRTSCGARRPLRENVSFFDDGAAAARAGFRACKRCKPDEADAQAALVTRLCRAIEASDDLLTTEELGSIAGMSPFHVVRLFKRVVGVTPRAYARALRTQAVPRALREGSVTDAVYESGYVSTGRFYEEAGVRLGMTPSTARAGGRAQTIRYGVARCTLGLVLVATTARGVCAILLGAHRAELEADLRARFPAAEAVAEQRALRDLVASVVRLVDDPRASHALPLDVRGTAFQERVWQALSRVPPGETTTYAALAASLGAPSAVRAVARACGANPLAVAVPCHRVVGKDGDLRGYRWGLERKRALLEREAVTARRSRR